MKLSIAPALLNKRKTATTAKDVPVISVNMTNGSFQPDAGKEEAFPYISLPIKFHAQQHINMCGDACVNMLFAYARKTPPANLAQNPRGIMEGMDRDAIKASFSGLTSWRPKWASASGGSSSMAGLTPMRLAYGVTNCGPLMFSGSFARFLAKRWGHWIVVHGVMDNTVLIADPWHGNERKKPFSWFLQHVDKDAGELPLYVY